MCEAEHLVRFIKLDLSFLIEHCRVKIHIFLSHNKVIDLSLKLIGLSNYIFIIFIRNILSLTKDIFT